MRDVRVFFIYAKISLRGIGFWPEISNASFLKKFFYQLYCIFITVTCGAQVIQGLVYLYLENPNFEIVINNVLPLVGSSQILTKIIVFKLYKVEVQTLLDKIEEAFETGLNDSGFYLRRYFRRGEIACGIAIFSLSATLFEYWISPLFSRERELPMDYLWYPFDYKNSTILFCATYIAQTPSMIAAFMSVGPEVIFNFSVFYCCARFKILRKKLLAFNGLYSADRESVDGENGESISAIKLQREISACVKAHCQVFGLMKTINTSFSTMVLAIYSYATIIVCLAGFSIIYTLCDGVNHTIKHVLAIPAEALQLFIFYSPASFLAIQADSFTDAAFNSGWEKFPPKLRRQILMIITGSIIVTPKLRAGPIQFLVLENYTTFVTSAMSFFTFLQAVAARTTQNS